MAISAVDAINPAFEHAKRQLLQPFRFTQWARLAVVGFLAGELGSGGGANFNFPTSWPSTPQDKGTEQLGHAWMASPVAHFPSASAGAFLFAFVAVLAVIMLFLYISSVMRFVLFDSVVAGECHIRQGWRRRKQEGWQLFIWQILLMLVTFTVFIVLIGVPIAAAWAFGWFASPREHLLQLVFGGLLLVFLFLGVVAIAAVVHVMTKDFVVPQMALESISATEGWRRLLLWIKAEKGGYAGYIGMKIVLAIGAGIFIGVITLIVLLIMLLPIGGAGILAVLAGKAAGLNWNLYTIALAVVVGCIVLALVMFVVSFLNVPAIVFFPAYSLYFLAGRYRPLAEALWPAPPAAESS